MQFAFSIHGPLHCTTLYKGPEHLNFGVSGELVGGWQGMGEDVEPSPTDIKGWVYFFLDYSIFKEMAEGNIVYIASHPVFFFFFTYVYIINFSQETP